MATKRDFISQFIAKFKELPCLWQVTHKDYRNKHKKDLALEELLDIYITRDPEASIDTVRKKIQSLRSCYRKENNKVKASIRAGSGDVHIPKLWYYDQLLFLTEDDTKSSASTIESVLIDPFEDMEEIDSDDFDSTAINVMSPSSQSSGSQRCASLSSNATKRKRSKIQAEDALSRILDRLDELKPPAMQRQKYEALENIFQKN
nr:unnamed protein product [Callosobruchus chinensis]